MAKGLNKVTVMGNLTKDIEVKQTTKGREYTRFALAVSDDYKDKSGQPVKQTEFVNCMAWGTTASIIRKYAVKGKPLLVEGKIKTDNYEKDGQKHYNTYVLVTDVYLVYFGNKPQVESGPEEGEYEEGADEFSFGNNAPTVY